MLFPAGEGWGEGAPPNHADKGNGPPKRAAHITRRDANLIVVPLPFMGEARSGFRFRMSP